MSTNMQADSAAIDAAASASASSRPASYRRREDAEGRRAPPDDVAPDMRQSVQRQQQQRQQQQQSTLYDTASVLADLDAQIRGLDATTAWAAFTLTGNEALGEAARFLEATPAERLTAPALLGILRLAEALPAQHAVRIRAAQARAAVATLDDQGGVRQLALRHGAAFERLADIALVAAEWCGRMAAVPWRADEDAPPGSSTWSATQAATTRLSLFTASVAVRRQAAAHLATSTSADAWNELVAPRLRADADSIYARLGAPDTEMARRAAVYEDVTEWLDARRRMDSAATSVAGVDSCLAAAALTYRAVRASSALLCGAWASGMLVETLPDCMTAATAGIQRAYMQGEIGAGVFETAASEQAFLAAARAMLGIRVSGMAQERARRHLERTLRDVETLRAHVAHSLARYSATVSAAGIVASSKACVDALAQPAFVSATTLGAPYPLAASAVLASVYKMPAELLFEALSDAMLALCEAVALFAQRFSEDATVKTADRLSRIGANVDEDWGSADADTGSDSSDVDAEIASMRAANARRSAESKERAIRDAARRVVEAEGLDDPVLIEQSIDVIVAAQRKALDPKRLRRPIYSMSCLLGAMMISFGLMMAVVFLRSLSVQRAANESSRVIVGQQVAELGVLSGVLQSERQTAQASSTGRSVVSTSSAASIFELNALRDDMMALDVSYKATPDDAFVYDDVLRRLEPFCRSISAADFGGSDGDAWALQCNRLRVDTVSVDEALKIQRVEPVPHAAVSAGRAVSNLLSALGDGFAEVWGGTRRDRTADGAGTQRGSSGVPGIQVATDAPADEAASAVQIVGSKATLGMPNSAAATQDARQLGSQVELAEQRYTRALAESDTAIEALRDLRFSPAYREYALGKYIQYRSQLRARAATIGRLYDEWGRSADRYRQTKLLAGGASAGTDGASELAAATTYMALADDLDRALLTFPEAPVLREMPPSDRAAAWSNKVVLAKCARELATLLARRVDADIDKIYSMPDVKSLGVYTRRAEQRGMLDSMLRRVGLTSDEMFGSLGAGLFASATLGANTPLLLWLYSSLVPIAPLLLTTVACLRLSWHNGVLYDQLRAVRGEKRIGALEDFGSAILNDAKLAALAAGAGLSFLRTIVQSDITAISTTVGGVVGSAALGAVGLGREFGIRCRAASTMRLNSTAQDAQTASSLACECGQPARYRCCGAAVYCGGECQALAWIAHRRVCARTSK